MTTGYNIREGAIMLAARIALLGEGESSEMTTSGNTMAATSPSPSGSVPPVAAPTRGDLPQPARSPLRVRYRGHAGMRPLREGERVVNGRILFCEAWQR